MHVIQMAKRRITHIKIEHKIAHIKIVHIKIEQMHTSRSHTSRSNINKLAPRRRANAGIGNKHIKIKHKRAFRRRANAHIKIRKCTLLFCHDRIEISSVELRYIKIRKCTQIFRSVALGSWAMAEWDVFDLASPPPAADGADSTDEASKHTNSLLYSAFFRAAFFIVFCWCLLVFRRVARKRFPGTLSTISLVILFIYIYMSKTGDDSVEKEEACGFAD